MRAKSILPAVLMMAALGDMSASSSRPTSNGGSPNRNGVLMPRNKWSKRKKRMRMQKESRKANRLK